MMIESNDPFNLLGLIFAGLLELFFFSFSCFLKRALVEKPVFVIPIISEFQHLKLAKFCCILFWKWHKIWNGGSASSLRVFGKLVCGSCFLPFELVWCQYVLLIISIGIYYLRKGVYLIPLSKCVYREAQQYISMSRKQNIRNFNVVFYAC